MTPGGVNNYDIACGWQGACRYPMDTILSNMARDSPSSTPDFQKNVNKNNNNNNKDNDNDSKSYKSFVNLFVQTCQTCLTI